MSVAALPNLGSRGFWASGGSSQVFPALTVPGITKAFAEGDEAQIDFGKGTVTNLRTGEELTGNKLPKEMLDILEADGIEGVLKQKGYIR